VGVGMENSKKKNIKDKAINIGVGVTGAAVGAAATAHAVHAMNDSKTDSPIEPGNEQPPTETSDVSTFLGADLDGDGAVDAVMADIDGDGVIDGVAIQDSDGTMYAAFDSSGDGVIDGVAIQDSDGTMYAAVDSNGDGVIDAAGVDFTHDGNPDVIITETRGVDSNVVNQSDISDTSFVTPETNITNTSRDTHQVPNMGIPNGDATDVGGGIGSGADDIVYGELVDAEIGDVPEIEDNSISSNDLNDISLPDIDDIDV